MEMEQFSNIKTENIQNEPTRKFSQNQPISTPNGKPANLEISPIEHGALFAVVNQSRLVNGWITRTAKEFDPTIRTWHKIFNYYQIPPAHVILDRLYLRALDTRQTFRGQPARYFLFYLREMRVCECQIY